jgi:hypothetical protein
MPARRVRLPKVTCAELVYRALMEARPRGLTLHQLVAATKLSEHHVRVGLAFIRDEMAMAQKIPLTWDRVGHYRLGPDAEDFWTIACNAMENLATRAERVISGMIGPYTAAHPEDQHARLILDHFTGVRATLLLTGRHPLARPRKART